MTVGNGYAKTLCSDDRTGRGNDFSVFNLTPNSKGLTLALFFLASDKGNEVVNHFGPLLKGLACTGNRLIGGRNHLLDAVLKKGSKSGNVGLNGAVRLNGDKAALSAESLLLRINSRKMCVVDFGNYHGNVGRPSVCGVIGNNGNLRLRITLLKLLGFRLGHIYSAENKINKLVDSRNIVGRKNLHVHYFFGTGRFHLPSAFDNLGVFFACRARACHKSGNFKIRVLVKEHNKSLTYHAGRADNTNFNFLHFKNSFFIIILIKTAKNVNYLFL